MSEQKELTKAELQIMQVLWRKENAFGRAASGV